MLRGYVAFEMEKKVHLFFGVSVMTESDLKIWSDVDLLTSI